MPRRASISEPTPFPVHRCPYPRGAPQLNQAHPSASRRRDQDHYGERLRVSFIHPFASAGDAPGNGSGAGGVDSISRSLWCWLPNCRHSAWPGCERDAEPPQNPVAETARPPPIMAPGCAAPRSGMAIPPGDGKVLTNGITHHARICRGTASPNSRAVIPPSSNSTPSFCNWSDQTIPLPE
jgi:hypothetical protein